MNKNIKKLTLAFLLGSVPAVSLNGNMTFNSINSVKAGFVSRLPKIELSASQQEAATLVAILAAGVVALSGTVLFVRAEHRKDFHDKASELLSEIENWTSYFKKDAPLLWLQYYQGDYAYIQSRLNPILEKIKGLEYYVPTQEELDQLYVIHRTLSQLHIRYLKYETLKPSTLKKNNNDLTLKDVAALLTLPFLLLRAWS